jgi:predicted NUDIX family NTP pyrophosphohydrolase
LDSVPRLLALWVKRLYLAARYFAGHFAEGGKAAGTWACEGDLAPAALVSNACKLEWPLRSGKRLPIPGLTAQNGSRWARRARS